jgi:MFS transporter, ACDE family, multidrug resistance protein
MNKTTQSIYLNPTMLIVAMVSLVVVGGVTAITPALPLIMQQFKIDAKHIGWIMTTLAIPGILLALFLGVIIDRFGRKIVLAPSLLIFGLAGGFCGFVKNYNLLLWLRVISGIGLASLAILTVTIIGDMFEGEDRIKAMGFNGGIVSISAAIAPAFGGWLAIYGWNYPFMLAFGSIPIGIIVWKFLKLPKPQNHASLNNYLSNTINAIKNKKLIILFIALTVNYLIIFGAWVTYFPIFLSEQFNLTSKNIGLLIASGSIMTAIISIRITHFTKYLTEQKLFAFSYLLYFLVMIMLSFATDIWSIVILCSIMGIAQGLNMPTALTMITEYAPQQYRASVVSVFSLILRTGQGVGPVIFGVFYGVLGLHGLFNLAAILSTATFLFAFFLIKDYNYPAAKA